nr:integrator complex subunit 5 isoform X2 [Halyomorpha halys]
MNVPGTSVIKQLPPKDLRAELRLFIAGVGKPSTGSPLELIRKGFSLLKSLPASKDAVLEYFGSFYEKSVANYLKHLENGGNRDSASSLFDQGDSILNEIHLSLYNFISTNPAGWRIIFIKWSLNLLGTISTKYADRGRAPVNGSLSDSLHQWLSCRATRSLIDINNHCITLLESHECFEPIIFLLDTCVMHSPHFDWVVAQVGGCFPNIVISRVLIAGLQDFANNHGSTNSPKIKSVLDILIHLAGCHQDEIFVAFKDIFNWALDPDVSADDRGGLVEKKAAVAYLLTLASRSSVLLTSLRDVALELITPETSEKLIPYGKHWISYCNNHQALFNLVVHLIISINDKADEIFIKLLLPFATYHNSDISSVAEEILGLLLKELDILSRGNASKIPFLESIGKNKEDLLKLVLSDKEVYRSSAVSMICFMGHQNVDVLPECVAYVILNSNKDEHLDAVVKFSQNYTYKEVMAPAINKTLNETDKGKLTRLWANLIKLSKWEASGTFISLPLLESVYTNLIPIAGKLCLETDVKIALAMTELIQKPLVDSSRPLNIKLIRAVSDAMIAFFYLYIMQSEWIEQIKCVKISCVIVKKLCSIGGLARNHFTRELLNNCIKKKPSVLFGAIPYYGTKIIQPPESLMEENNKQGTSSILAQKHSVFHAGVIGTGKRKSEPQCPVPYEKVVHSTGLLMQFLTSATECGAPQATLEAVISVALLLVEFVSPNIMYNGLPWPEEEFCKVTIERDLKIRKMLDDTPVIWSLLSFIAHHRPALCYCSVILRAVVHILLRDCVWNYLRDHVPSPALFTRDANGVMWRDLAAARPSKQYTETMRHLMIQNIAALGPLYYTLFVQDQDED